MKKVFTMVCLMLVTVLAMAQNIKKVAILEVVDRESKLSYSQKLMLRSNMAQAITNTQGYEAYDRTDMDAILSEQNFQRTGLVSDDQIKQLGIMTGAQFVLIVEAVEVESLNLYVTAKLLDVETSRIETSGNEIMKNTAQDISRGCQALAKTLFKPTTTIDPKKPITQQKTVTQQQTEPTITTKVKYRGDQYLYENKTIGKNRAYHLVLNDIKNQPQYWELSFYKELKKSNRMITAGWILMGGGVAILSAGIVGYTTYMSNTYAYMLMGTSSALFIPSISLLSVGYSKRNRTVRNLTTGQTTPIAFNMIGSQNGIGLAMQF